MIATIVFGLFILVCVILGVYYRDDEEWIGFISIILLLIFSGILGHTLSIGALPSDEKRQYIIYCLEDETNVESIKKAVEYNDNILEGNNYWCRFKLYNEEDYLIDIELYINKREKINENTKIK